MTASTFERALFHEQTPALAQAFDEAVEGLFAPHKPAKARLEVYAADCIRSLSANTKDRSQSRTNLRPVPDHRESPLPGVLETESIESIPDLLSYIQSNEALQFVFIAQRNSYSRLSASFELLEALCRERDVSAQFRDYILYFGDRESEIEVAPPALRIRPLTWADAKSQLSFECLCGIRYVEPNTRTDVSDHTARWSLRQCAIYYRTAPLPKGQIVVLATLSHTCRRRLDQYLLALDSFDSTNFFEITVLIAETVIGNWRPYIVALNIETEHHAAQLLGASPDNRGPIGMADAGQRQILMLLDDKMGNSVLAMRSTKDDLKRLAQFHAERSVSPKSGSSVAIAIEELVNELERLVIKVEVLQSRLNGIANLVSNFLDLSNGFALQQLGKESRRENEQMRLLSERMHKLTEKGTQDAAAVKVLTILTLVYLPLTVVTNFFSTSFIGTSTTSNKIFVTKDWWILVAASVPLTLITLYVWWVWSRIKAHQKYPWWWPSFGRPPPKSKVRLTAEKDRDLTPDHAVLERHSTDWGEER